MEKVKKQSWAHWSATKIEAADCMRRAFYLYEDDLSEHPQELTVPLVAGQFIHSGCAAYLGAHKKPRYASAESYSGQRVGRWKHLVARTGTYREQKIREEKPGELYVAAESIVRPCSRHFYELFHDARPLAVEYHFRVRLGDFIFSGAIDAIQDGLTYLDYKTDDKRPRFDEEKKEKLLHTLDALRLKTRMKRERARVEEFLDGRGVSHADALLFDTTVRTYLTEKREWTPSSSYLRYRYQFTLYSVVLPFLVASDAELRSRMTLTPAQQRALDCNPLDLLPEIQGKYVRLQNGVLYDIPQRSAADVVELLNIVESRARRAELGDFSHTRGKHCETCFVRKKCDHDTLEERVISPYEHQHRRGYLLFPPRQELKVYTEIPQIFVLPPESKKRLIHGSVQGQPSLF